MIFSCTIGPCFFHSDQHSLLALETWMLGFSRCGHFERTRLCTGNAGKIDLEHFAGTSCTV